MWLYLKCVLQPMLVCNVYHSGDWDYELYICTAVTWSMNGLLLSQVPKDIDTQSMPNVVCTCFLVLSRHSICIKPPSAEIRTAKHATSLDPVWPYERHGTWPLTDNTPESISVRPIGCLHDNDRGTRSNTKSKRLLLDSQKFCLQCRDDSWLSRLSRFLGQLISRSATREIWAVETYHEQWARDIVTRGIKETWGHLVQFLGQRT